MALLDPYSCYVDLATASMFDNIPTNFIPDEEEDHHDFNNLLPPPPQPLFFDHHHISNSITTPPPPPDSYYYDCMIHFHDHPDDHYIHTSTTTTTIPTTPADSSYDFHFADSDLYSHHHHHQQLHPAGCTELIGFEEDSTFFPPDLSPLYLPPQQLQDDYLLFDHEPPPKRHKSSHYPPSNNCTIPPPPPFHHHFSSPNYPNTVAAASDFDDTFNAGYYYNKEKGRQQGRPTAQSIAARERRKRISNKTQGLARLLPGAPAKMNTADMLQNAFTYVKFLQAQVHLLHLIMDSPAHSSCQDKAAAQNLQVLSSSAVQEKLYTNHKCLVPLEFLTHLAQDLPHLTNDLTHFITTLSFS